MRVSECSSATAGLSVDLSNCQPFQSQQVLGVHNGFIANFRQTLYRPIREHLSDRVYQSIQGTTDSEHIFALLMNELLENSELSLTDALTRSLTILDKLGKKYTTDFSANLIISDGQQIVASRYASREPVPSLYWLRDDPLFPDAVLIASEPLFDGNWISFRDRSILTIDHDLNIETHDL